MTHEEYLLTPEWRALKGQTLERDGYRCRVCDRHADDVRLEVHHRRYPPGGEWMLDSLDSLTTLCEPCHSGFSAVRLVPVRPAPLTTALPKGHQHPVHASNPSIPEPGVIDKRKRHQTDNGLEWRAVDSEQYIKLYLDGLKRATELSKAGLAVFELVYHELQRSPNKDTIMLTIRGTGMSKAIYYNGLRNLLDNEFLFRSPFDGVFFVNVRYLFNGDRIAFLKNNARVNSERLARSLALRGLDGERDSQATFDLG